MTLAHIAEAYVKLVLAVGQHDAGYVDAYYGPAEWQVESRLQPLAELQQQAGQLLLQARALPVPATDQQDRQQLLVLQLVAVQTYVAQLAGVKLSFDAESAALYDAVSPGFTPTDFDLILAELELLLPGQGELNARLTAYNREFEIPRERLDAVFSAAIREARARTRQHIDLPADEDFKIEYVTEQVWSAYNWYKGNSYSLIQVNTDFPMSISRAIDLASHEGYPGHHVFNLLLEKHLVNEKGWVEFTVYPLYSPLSILAEGSANYGIQVAFPPAERLAFERETLFPLAGIAPEKAERYYQIQAVLQKLSYAGNMVAQRYLDGQIGQDAALALLMKYALSDEQRSAQRLRFMERHRSYVINYNLGQDLVQAYVEQRAGNDNQRRWQVLAELLAQPKSASMMRA